MDKKILCSLNTFANTVEISSSSNHSQCNNFGFEHLASTPSWVHPNEKYIMTHAKQIYYNVFLKMSFDVRYRLLLQCDSGQHLITMLNKHKHKHKHDTTFGHPYITTSHNKEQEQKKTSCEQKSHHPSLKYCASATEDDIILAPAQPIQSIQSVQSVQSTTPPTPTLATENEEMLRETKEESNRLSRMFGFDRLLYVSFSTKCRFNPAMTRFYNKLRNKKNGEKGGGSR